MPSYVAPTFNLTCNIWHSGTPTTDPPDLSPLCQLYIYSRTSVDIDPTDPTKYVPPIFLRCPIGTDLKVGDIAECIAGTGFFYTIRWVERMHLGFPNEYIAGLCHQGDGGIPPGAGELLLEDGTDILLEDGSLILLE